MKVNSSVIEPTMIHQLLIEGGSLVGIGSFRPEKDGMFGTFGVVLWERLPDSAVVTRHKTLASVNGG